MEQPTISPDQAVHQAGMTVHEYLRSSIKMLDEQFGEGFADKHPELAVRLVECHVQDFATTAKIDPVYEIATALGTIAHSIEVSGA